MGMVLLGVWLILTGLFGLVSGVAGLGIVLTLLAIAAGVVLLLGISGSRVKNRNPGFLLLSIWLIVTGLRSLLPLNITGIDMVMGVLAIGAGILLLVGARGRSLSRYPGMTLLSVWLFITGLLALTPVGIPGLGAILALLAAAAGVLILLGR